MAKTIDVNRVVGPLAHDASYEVIRRQQMDTAQLVGQVVSNIRVAVAARVEEKARTPRDVRPRLDVDELQKELAALNTRLEMCRSNLAMTSKNQDGKLRFLRLGERRAAALKEALERLQRR